MCPAVAKAVPPLERTNYTKSSIADVPLQAGAGDVRVAAGEGVGWGMVIKVRQVLRVGTSGCRNLQVLERHLYTLFVPRRWEMSFGRRISKLCTVVPDTR